MLSSKGITRLFAIVAVSIGLLTTLPQCSGRSFDNTDQKLEALVAGFVLNDKSVRNCVLAVAKGDGSLNWSGAAGIGHQNGQAPMTKDTPIYIASVTKLYTATAIMRLSESGALSLDDPMSKYLPDKLIRGIHVYEGTDYSSKITIRQLVSHTSGIADYYDEKPKGGKNLFEVFIEQPERPWTVEETIERARKDLRPNFAPGTRTSYSDTNFQLLGKIIEAATGKPLHVVFDELFFRPLGLTHTWMIGRSKPLAPSSDPADVFYKDMNITKTRSNGAYWAEGGIVSTAEEMIVFLKALNEGRIIRGETVQAMHDWRSWHFPLRYGYGTMLFKMPPLSSRIFGVPPLWGHSGSTGSFLYYSEDLNLYMAGTIDQVDAKVAPFKLMRAAMKAVRSGLTTSKQKTYTDSSLPEMAGRLS
ncbi:MAG TPA: serine hydrolase domain-containing protein [Syntrophorhabdaceae bacterium]|nr:serine hydrolase domain-containing protein [Syntrophorhabdaceae bacterium]